MKKLVFTIFTVLLTVQYIYSQNDVLNLINRSDMQSYMYFLASDELQGRETGEPGNNIAARYIATNLMRLGLKPGSGDNSFLQSIPFSSTIVNTGKSFIKSFSADGREIFSSDSILSVLPLSESSEVEGELVFAGYGYENKSTGYSDMRGLNIKDKIVLVMTRNPEILKSLKGKDDYIFNERLEQGKLMSILTAGPKAMIFVYDASNRFSDPWNSGLEDLLGSTESVTVGDKPSLSLPFKILFITRKAADNLLSPSGYSLQQVQEKILKEDKPVSSEINGITVKIKLDVENRKLTGYNVIGIIEGSDPVLKNECIVYSAHFDHTGINSNGEINNGADDDASGSVALLELAEAFSSMKKKPLRTIVFAWVNGEEKGLLGSKYYTDNPVIPMENTILDINIDMIGRSKTAADTGSFLGARLDVTEAGEVMLYNDEKSDPLHNLIMNSAAKTGIKVSEKGATLAFGGSDHQSFAAKGVPWLLFHSGIHRDLHSPGDDPDKIDYEKMEKVTRMLFLIGNSVASQKVRFYTEQE